MCFWEIMINEEKLQEKTINQGKWGGETNSALCGKLDIENTEMSHSYTFVRNKLIGMVREEPVLVSEEVVSVYEWLYHTKFQFFFVWKRNPCRRMQVNEEIADWKWGGLVFFRGKSENSTKWDEMLCSEGEGEESYQNELIELFVETKGYFSQLQLSQLSQSQKIRSG